MILKCIGKGVLYGRTRPLTVALRSQVFQRQAPRPIASSEGPNETLNYHDLGLKRVNNAHAYMTPIGVSIMPPEVVEAMADAAPYFVDIHALNRKAGEMIAMHTG